MAKAELIKVNGQGLTNQQRIDAARAAIAAGSTSARVDSNGRAIAEDPTPPYDGRKGQIIGGSTNNPSQESLHPVVKIGLAAFGLFWLGTACFVLTQADYIARNLPK